MIQVDDGQIVGVTEPNSPKSCLPIAVVVVASQRTCVDESVIANDENSATTFVVVVVVVVHDVQTGAAQCRADSV